MRHNFISAVLAASFLIIAPFAGAQNSTERIFLLLSADSGAPTASEIVDEYNFSSGGTPPLEGLLTENPTGAAYLLPMRAQGSLRGYLLANPELPRAILERYIILSYPEQANLGHALSVLAMDPYVEKVYRATVLGDPPALVPALANGPVVNQVAAPGIDQWWLSAARFTNAWNLAGGWGLVGVIDVGIATSHPDLVAYDSSHMVTGGNFLPAFSLDNGRYVGAIPPPESQFDSNVDEQQPIPWRNSPCNPAGTGAIAANAGHGTHVAGLISANHANADGTKGTCRNCGLAVVKASIELCRRSSDGSYKVEVRPNDIALFQGLTYLVDAGVQVVNISSGGSNPVNCSQPLDALSASCIALDYANGAGVVVVAASGNDKGNINFPARNRHVSRIGGLDEANLLWRNRTDLPAAHINALGCPSFYGAASTRECGTNTSSTDVVKQEVVAPARAVFSLTYPNKNWSEPTQCGDSFGTPAGDGRGVCTGTSMASPIAAGLAAIVKSANPLLLPGDPELMSPSPEQFGVRNIITRSAFAATLADWDPEYGYGRLNAEGAVRMTLGTSRSIQLTNRLSPLFSLRSTNATDWAYTTIPQMAVTLMLKGMTRSSLLESGAPNADWRPQGAEVRGYPAFPGQNLPGTPRASIFVFTTETPPFANSPPLVPLYMLDRSRNWPAGCSPGPGCNVENRDFLLVTSASHVKIALDDGYVLRGRQGYIFSACGTQAGCAMPTGAEAVHRKCKVTDDDCAIFPERERVTKELEGYTAVYPSGSPSIIGYAFANQHHDKDDLIDGVEWLLGTNPTKNDSDSDGSCDDDEYSIASVPVSDPCSDGGCNPDRIFASSFQDVSRCALDLPAT